MSSFCGIQRRNGKALTVNFAGKLFDLLQDCKDRKLDFIQDILNDKNSHEEN